MPILVMYFKRDKRAYSYRSLSEALNRAETVTDRDGAVKVEVYDRTGELVITVYGKGAGE